MKDNKTGIIKRISESFKLQGIFLIVSMLVLYVTYIIVLQVLEKDVIIRKDLNAPDEAISYISDANISDGYLMLNGWSLRQNMNIESVKILFTSVNDGDSIVCETVNENSESLKEYIKYFEISQGYSSFSSKIKKMKFDDASCYRLDLYIKGTSIESGEVSEYKDTTSQYWYQGELYSYNPLKFSSLNFSDESMQQVIESGYLCSYSAANGAWIYLYEDCLYWILDLNSERNRNEDLYMFFHLYTTKPEQLPEKRQPYKYDNRDFYFKDYELDLGQEAEYRVAKMNIAVEYPITYIYTGEYNFEKNVWSVKVENPFVASKNWE